MERYLGLFVTILVIIVVFVVQDNLATNKSNEYKEKYRKALIDKYGESTVTYFDVLDCSELESKRKEYQFTKIFLIYRTDCSLSTNSYDFLTNSKLAPYLSDNVDEVEYISWISDNKQGQIYNNYTNGGKAIRRNYLLSVIDKEFKVIVDQKTFIGLGDPPMSIKRKQGDDRPEYFGHIPADEIIDYLYQKTRTIN